jgi:hypothetical protein
MPSTMRKSTHLVRKAHIATDATYEALGIKRTDKKDKDQAQARAAMGVALCEYLSHTNACKPLGRDRSTISTYVYKHDDNMKYWSGYAQKYNVARGICEIHMHGAARDYDISVIDRQISQYQKKINELQLEKKKLSS